jgi:hypothetical protein
MVDNTVNVTNRGLSERLTLFCQSMGNEVGRSLAAASVLQGFEMTQVANRWTSKP